MAESSRNKVVDGKDLVKILMIQPSYPNYRWGVLKRITERREFEFRFLQLRVPDSLELPAFLADRIVNNRAQSPGKMLGIRWDVLKSFYRYIPDVLIMAPTPETPTQFMMALWQKLSGRRVILWHKGQNPLRDPLSMRSKVVDRSIGILKCMMDAVVVYGQEARRYFTELGIAEQTVFVAQNTIDTDEILLRKADIDTRSSVLKERHRNGRKWIILVLCTLKKEKRVDLALEIFRELESRRKDIQYIVVGDGPQRKNLECTAREMKLDNCIFMGRIPPFEENYYIAAADILLVTGSGGLAITQAMLLGTPVVCADELGSDTELIRHGETGFRVLRGDTTSMAKRCEELLDSPDMAKAIVAKARETILDVGTVNHMADGILEAISYCVHSSRLQSL